MTSHLRATEGLDHRPELIVSRKTPNLALLQLFAPGGEQSKMEAIFFEMLFRNQKEREGRQAALASYRTKRHLFLILQSRIPCTPAVESYAAAAFSQAAK